MGRVTEAVMDTVMAPMEWAMDAETGIGAVGKFLMVMPLYAAPVLAPLILAAHFNIKAMDQDIRDIDAGKSFGFTAVEQCVRKGYAQEQCKKSWDKASGYAGSIGAALTYSTRANCEAVHGPCREETVVIPIMNTINNMPVTTYIPSTSYYPRVVGWQMSAAKPEAAVPLYATPVPNIGFRNDGLRVTLD